MVTIKHNNNNNNNNNNTDDDAQVHAVSKTVQTDRQTVGAMPSLREVPDLSERRPGFSPRSANVGFVVDRVSLKIDFLRVLQLCPVSVISCSTPTHRSSTSLNCALGA